MAKNMPYFSSGNIKVKCLIFSLPSKITCKQGLSCHKYCYAAKAEIQYKQVLPCRLNNLELSKRDDFVNNVVSILNKKRCKYVRIHESGDFYSKEYILKWYSIINAMPNKTFYAYTKRDDLFTEDLLNQKPSNLILIYSLDGIQDDRPCSIPRGFDSVAYIHEKSSTCPAQSLPDLKCIQHCKKCLQKDQYICFKKH